MHKELKRVAVTGGAGQIAYNLLFRIASGEMLGIDQPVALHILEVPEALKMLDGVVMELLDCAFPLLKEIHVGSDPEQVFAGVHYALLIGAKPRGPGMERGELLADNGKIFMHQGRALNDSAAPTVKVLIVGNPCNTNCLIAMHHAPRIPATNFHAMTRLDQNRAIAQLALKADVNVSEVANLTIWGNHSSTQVPDFIHAKIAGKPVQDQIRDRSWLENNFIQMVQKRGAEIIAARGKSSAASAANAVIDAIKDLETETKKDHWFSSAVYSKGNPYNIDPNLFFSFPCCSNGNGSYQIVSHLQWDDFLTKKIKLSEKELIEERDLVKHLLVI